MSNAQHRSLMGDWLREDFGSPRISEDLLEVACDAYAQAVASARTPVAETP